MHRRAHAAYALGDGPRVARIAADQDLLQPAYHRACAECVRDDAVLHHRLNAQVAFNSSYGINNNACHSSSTLLLFFCVHFRNDLVLANVGDHRVRGHSGQRGNAHHGANRVGRALNAESRERRQVLVERAVVPEALFAAANASMARLNRIAGALVPPHHRAGVVGHRPLQPIL